MQLSDLMDRMETIWPDKYGGQSGSLLAEQIQDMVSGVTGEGLQTFWDNIIQNWNKNRAPLPADLREFLPKAAAIDRPQQVADPQIAARKALLDHAITRIAIKGGWIYPLYQELTLGFETLHRRKPKGLAVTDLDNIDHCERRCRDINTNFQAALHRVKTGTDEDFVIRKKLLAMGGTSERHAAEFTEALAMELGMSPDDIFAF